MVICLILSLLVSSLLNLMKINSQKILLSTKLDTDIFLITDNKDKVTDLRGISTELLKNRKGAVTIVDVNNAKDKRMELSFSGWGTLFWVNVQKENIASLLRMMDETMIQMPTFIRAGIWSKQNKFIFQVDDEKSKELILNHKNAGRHAHAIIVKEEDYTWEITMSRSHKMVSYKKVKRLTTPEYLEELFMRKTDMSKETIRVGCLPYSHYVRATATENTDGSLEYSDFWGYEVIMLEHLAKKQNFKIEFHPPEDGLWGAIEATGNMSGLIGQAAYGEVDFAMSAMMTSLDRFNVADNPISFDTEHMVFVSPPPGEKNKAVALFSVFTLYMWSIIIGMVLLFGVAIFIVSWIIFMINPKNIDEEWLSYSACVWFTFSTFIGESVMRYEGSISHGAMKAMIGLWYLYALVATAAYAGEVRSFLINPGTTRPLDNLGEVVQSGLGWGLILYGEEEEKVMEASTDPIISNIWKMKEEVPFDETYEILKRVAKGEFVFLDYKNGVGPQIEIKYKKGDRKFIHQASHHWTKISGVGWYFNKLFPHTELFGDFLTQSIETGLVSAWMKQTLARMKEEYLQSDEDKVVLPDINEEVAPLTLQDFGGPFFLLFAGLCISTIVHLALVLKVLINYKIQQ